MSKHAEEAGETYWQHFRYACGLAWRLWKMTLAMLVHAVFPDWKRFDGRVLPFVEDLKARMVVRQMKVVHHRLVKRVMKRLKEEDSEENGSNGHL